MTAEPNLHDVGDLVRLSVTFRNLAGAATDPAEVKLRVQDPLGNVDVHTWPPDNGIVNDATTTGVFVALITPDESGDWWYRWHGTGAVQEVEEARFRVRTRVVG